MSANEERGLYDEEMECWVANQSAIRLFFFGIACVILALSNPFIWLYVKIKVWYRWRGK